MFEHQMDTVFVFKELKINDNQNSYLDNPD